MVVALVEQMFHIILVHSLFLVPHNPKAHKWHIQVGIVWYTKMARLQHNPLPSAAVCGELVQVIFDCISDRPS